MARLLAIDYGRRRCGIAVTDPMRIVATGLPTVSTSQLIQFVKQYVTVEDVDAIIVGHPKDMHGNDSESMNYIRPGIDRLRKELPAMEIIFWDERFTSVLAHKGMIDSGMKKMQRRQKGIADEMAAVIILNSYLESRKYNES
ncbi:MAG: Holliday junction resolvase RuvX [Paramuribaculum sp.]|nr:Holliday junction resolvase RuvX [Paramuribaculum sp.]